MGLATDELARAEGCYFDEVAAERVREFFARFLRHGKGQWAGQPFELQEWQWLDVTLPLYGWKRADGSRRFRQAYIEIPKKNGKSTWCAGLELYHLIADCEPGAEVYTAARDRGQASIIFREVLSMVRQSPALRQVLRIKEAAKEIHFDAGGCMLKALSADASSQEGLNASACIIDELHAHQSPELYNVLRFAGAARRQPLLLSITTAGYDRDSICWDVREYAKGVAEGRITDTTFFTYIRGAEDTDDWRAESTWRKANPSYGVTINPIDFAAEAKEAATTPERENSFKRYRLDVWTTNATAWITDELWQACGGEPVDEGAWFGGLDLASVNDLASFVLFHEPTSSVRAWHWIPKGAAKQRERLKKFRLAPWVAAGHIKQIDSETIDYDVIRNDINAIAKRYEIKCVAVDPWNAVQLSNQLRGDGLTVEKFIQGFRSFTGPVRELERRVLDGRLRHGGNPVMRWQVGNVVIVSDAAGNAKPAKDRSADKIDGVVALLMAVGKATDGGGKKPSKYAEGGLSCV